MKRERGSAASLLEGSAFHSTLVFAALLAHLVVVIVLIAVLLTVGIASEKRKRCKLYPFSCALAAWCYPTVCYLLGEPHSLGNTLEDTANLIKTLLEKMEVPRFCNGLGAAAHTQFVTDV